MQVTMHSTDEASIPPLVAALTTRRKKTVTLQLEPEEALLLIPTRPFEDAREGNTKRLFTALLAQGWVEDRVLALNKAVEAKLLMVLLADAMLVIDGGPKHQLATASAPAGVAVVTMCSTRSRPAGCCDRPLECEPIITGE